MEALFMSGLSVWFKGLRLKLLMVLMLPLLAMFAVGIVTVKGIRDEANDIRTLTKVRLPVTALTGEMRTHLHAMARYLWVAINSSEPKQATTALDDSEGRLKK